MSNIALPNLEKLHSLGGQLIAEQLHSFNISKVLLHLALADMCPPASRFDRTGRRCCGAPHGQRTCRPSHATFSKTPTRSINYAHANWLIDTLTRRNARRHIVPSALEPSCHQFDDLLVINLNICPYLQSTTLMLVSLCAPAGEHWV